MTHLKESAMSETSPQTSSRALPSVRKGWLLLVVLLLGGALLVIGSWATVATGQGADFGNVFNEPARAANGSAEIEWIDGEELLRSLEPQTREGIEFAWTRAFNAVDLAAAGGDAEGIEVWFSGSAQDQVRELLATGVVRDGGAWEKHDITPQFYSIDGQILVATIDRKAATSHEVGIDDAVRAVFILRDGNWRIEHMVRLDAAS